MSNKDKLFEEELARRNPDWEKIVAVHNAALDAEREKYIELCDKANGDMIALNKQLAAEREKVTARELANEMLTAQRNQLREQLAAAVEALKEIDGALKDFRQWYPEVTILDLAHATVSAALEKVSNCNEK